MLTAKGPPLIRSRLAPILATTCGVTIPGCTATIISIVVVRSGERGDERPSFKVRAKKPFGDQRDIEASGLRLAHDIDRKGVGAIRHRGGVVSLELILADTPLFICNL